jgi:hypothetical protein
MRASSVLFFQRRWRWLRWGAPIAALTGGLLGWWVVAWQADAKPDAVAAAQPSRAAATNAPSRATSAPYSAVGQQAREAQLVLWQQRLERAQQALQTYGEQTRYPHGSRPADEQSDQMFPNEPVMEEHPLREAGSKSGKAAEGVRLRTTQERVFVQGDESVRFTVSLVDEQGQALPLRVQSAAAREVTPPTVASQFPVLPVAFTDDGTGGDRSAGDRELTATLRPAAQGFAALAGQIRLEVFMEYRGERGFTYFDIYVSPDAPAAWSGRVRDVAENGSLNFYLGAAVREPGRYVVTGRIDDADGQPFALLTFNDEVGRGDTEFRLSLFGKLIRDAKPAMPLTLRDVVAFRLREEGHPDRALMPRLNGEVHVSGKHALASFSDAEWSGEERARYLAELTRDVDEAQKKVDQLTASPK